MINQKWQFKLGQKVHGLVTMDRFKTTCPKWVFLTKISSLKKKEF